MASTNLNTTTENKNQDKSLFAMAKDTLVAIKDSILSTGNFRYSDPNKAEIKGMSKAEFLAIKAILESKLRLRGMKGSSTLSAYASPFSPSNLTTNSTSTTVDRQFDAQFDGQTKLVDNKQQFGKVQSAYQEVNKEEWSKAPEVLFQKTTFIDDNKDDIEFAKKDVNEVHVLPTLKVQEKPTIIEREIEYEKPVQIKQTILHQEKPIIIEQPIIKQKIEHYRDATKFEKNEKKIVKEINESTNNHADTDAILYLRKNRIDNYSDTTPNIQQQKEKVQLETEYREQPTIVNEKEVRYEQPVEIQTTHIEKIKPVVREEVIIEKEHVNQKLAPEYMIQDAKFVNQGDQFFSKDTNDATITTNTTSTTTQNNFDMRDRQIIAGEEDQRKIVQ